MQAIMIINFRYKQHLHEIIEFLFISIYMNDSAEKINSEGNKLLL